MHQGIRLVHSAHAVIRAKLTFPEIKTALEVGTQRMLWNLKNGARENNGGGDAFMHDCRIDLLGARAEMAVAKVFNLFWSGSVGDYTAIDVGGVIEVRASHNPNCDLRIKKKDHDNVPYVCALEVAPGEFVLFGWLFGREGKQEKWWRDPGGKGRWSYWAPRSVLRPMEELLAKYRRG